MTTQTGTLYLLARAAKDSRIENTLLSFHRHRDLEDYVLAEQDCKTLDDLCFGYLDDGSPRFVNVNVIAAAEQLNAKLGDQ